MKVALDIQDSAIRAAWAETLRALAVEVVEGPATADAVIEEGDAQGPTRWRLVGVEDLGPAVLESVGSCLPAPCCWLDDHGRLAGFNAEFARTTVLDEATAIGVPLTDLLAKVLGDDPARWRSVFPPPKPGRTVWDMRLGTRWLRVLAQPLGPTSSGWVVLVVDMSRAESEQVPHEADQVNSRDRADQIADLERDVRLYNQFDLGTATRARSDVQVPWRKANPMAFHVTVRHYEDLLDRALDRAAHGGDPEHGEALRALASSLAQAEAGPRDVVDIHSMALRRKCSSSPGNLARAYTEEGRLLLLELMGYLLLRYRALVAEAAVHVPAEPSPSPHPHLREVAP